MPKGHPMAAKKLVQENAAAFVLGLRDHGIHMQGVGDVRAYRIDRAGLCSVLIRFSWPKFDRDARAS